MRTGSKRFIKTDGVTDRWNGFPVEVLQIRAGDLYLRPLVERPDGFNMHPFYWPTKDLVKRPPEGSNFE